MTKATDNAVKFDELFPVNPIWAIEPASHRTLCDNLSIVAKTGSYRWAARSTDNAAVVAAMMPLSVQDGVAVIDIAGPLTKNPSVFTMLFGGTSIALIREAVTLAVESESVKAIMLSIDSPGGSVDGLAEVADAIITARKSKPVTAQVTGMAASAAYYIASQAGKVYAQRMDLIGSIGTRMLVYDFSRAFANAGIEAVTIDTGPFKSTGVMGTELTEEQREYLQDIVDNYFEDFVSTIVRGRAGMTDEDVRAIADGRLFNARQAVEVGLIDGVQSVDVTFAGIVAGCNTGKRRAGVSAADKQGKDVVMSETEVTATPQAATIAQLKKALPGSTPQFREECIEGGLSVEDAKDLFIAQLNEDAAAKDATIAKLEKTSSSTGLGVEPTSEGATEDEDDFDGDAAKEWRKELAALTAKGMSRDKAVMRLNQKRPDLRAAYVEAHNREHRTVRRRIG